MLPKGDQRRAALLVSLGDLLTESSDLESVNVADISRRAGVTRSAFYFYFDNKAAAVTALAEQTYADALAAAHRLDDLAVAPLTRITSMLDGLFAAVEDHAPLVRATLEARASSADVRAVWDAQRLSFVEHLAGVVDAERQAGQAPAGADATLLATMLLELNDRAIERLVQGSVDRAGLLDTVASIWLRTIYSPDPASAPLPDPEPDPDMGPETDPDMDPESDPHPAAEGTA
ncbi:TetR/AcrR family transcriptional regulator [Nocardioides sp. CBS4Y-1]|uniref:TetR/AcrR family transcriptional regulator n=1 Tax=Nocardioides acrostichi TaxID=2784339 RepID=A0A930Y7Q6_9ACTN|nr:TetR/AcrR family transcriptional regulator [Nocardioides acrostichi]